MGDIQVKFQAKDETRGVIQNIVRNIEALKGSASGAGSALSGLSGAVGTIGKLSAVIGGAFAGIKAAQFVGEVQSVVHSMAELDDAAERTGASVEKLSGLQRIAKIGEFDFSQVEQGLIRLSKALAGADDEAKSAGRAFAALKLDPEKLRAMDTADAMKAVADALAKYRDGMGKTAIAQDILGKSGAALLPYLKDLAESGDLVGRVTAQQAAQAEQYEKNIKKLRAAFDLWGQGAKTAAAGVVPYLEQITSLMVRAQKEGGLLYSVLVGIGSVGLVLGGVELDPLKRAEKEAEATFTRLHNARKKLAEIATAPNVGGLAGGLMRDFDIKRLQQYIVEQEEHLKRVTTVRDSLARQGAGEPAAPLPALNYTGAGGGGKGGKAGKEFDPVAFRAENLVRAAKEAEKELQALEKNREEYSKDIRAMVGPLEAQAQALETEARGYGQSDAVIQRSVITRLEEARAMAAQNGAWPDHLAFLEREISARRRIAGASDVLRLDKLVDATPSAQLEKTREDMLFLTRAFTDGIENADGSLRKLSESDYLEVVQARLKSLPDALEKSKSAAEELGLTFSSAFEDAITGGKNFRDLLEGLEKDIIRIGTRKMVTEPFANYLTDKFKGLALPGFGGAAPAASPGEVGGGATGAAPGGDVLSNVFGQVTGAAKRLWNSLFTASDAAQTMGASVGDTTTKLVNNIVQQGAQTAAGTQATAGLVALAGSAQAATGALMSMAASGASGIPGGSAAGLGGALASAFGFGGGVSQLGTSPFALVDGSLMVLPFEKGGIMTPAGPVPLRAYSGGGIASSPQLALFGEGSMAEAYVPLPDGRSIPVNLNGGAGGTAIINMNISTPDAGSFRAAQGQVMADMHRALSAAGRRNQ